MYKGTSLKIKKQVKKKEYIQKRSLKGPLIPSVKLRLSYTAVVPCGDTKQEMMLPRMYVGRIHEMGCPLRFRPILFNEKYRLSLFCQKTAL